MLDTGASASIIDLGTVQRLQLESLVKRNERNTVNCYDASDNKMNIIGSILLTVGMIGCNDKVDHNFFVLGIQSNRSLLLGRDAMKKFKSVTFDFESKKIKIGRTWLELVSNTDKQIVRFCNEVTVTVVILKCNKDSALTSRQFTPRNIPGVRGV